MGDKKRLYGPIYNTQKREYQYSHTTAPIPIIYKISPQYQPTCLKTNGLHNFPDPLACLSINILLAASNFRCLRMLTLVCPKYSLLCSLSKLFAARWQFIFFAKAIVGPETQKWHPICKDRS